METLLEKIKKIEEEVTESSNRADKKHTDKMNDLSTAEPKVLEDVRVQAEKRGADIIKEKVQAAEAETNSMKQDEKRAVDSVHQTAAERREQAVTHAVNLFRDQYTK